MQVTRISKDRYKITCCEYEFTAVKYEYSRYWHIYNKPLYIHRLCDDLSEVFDFIDFLFS